MFYNFNTHNITTHYVFKWQFKNYPYLKVTTCGKIVNLKTGRLKKMCLNGYSKGVWVTSSKFLTNINNHITII
jgi:hypothetical protein